MNKRGEGPTLLRMKKGVVYSKCPKKVQANANLAGGPANRAANVEGLVTAVEVTVLMGLGIAAAGGARVGVGGVFSVTIDAIVMGAGFADLILRADGAELLVVAFGVVAFATHFTADGTVGMSRADLVASTTLVDLRLVYPRPEVDLRSERVEGAGKEIMCVISVGIFKREGDITLHAIVQILRSPAGLLCDDEPGVEGVLREFLFDLGKEDVDVRVVLFNTWDSHGDHLGPLDVFGEGDVGDIMVEGHDDVLALNVDVPLGGSAGETDHDVVACTTLGPVNGYDVEGEGGFVNRVDTCVH